MKAKSNLGLVVIDVQVAMFSDPEVPLFNGEKLIENIGRLLEKARSSSTPVFFIQHVGSDEGPFGLGKPTWEIEPRIKPLKNEVVVYKRSCDSFHQTILQEELQRQCICKLVIVGCQTEFCVDTTCRRAFSMGYDSILVKDSHSTFNGMVLTAPQIIEHHNGILGDSFVRLKQIDEIDFRQL